MIKKSVRFDMMARKKPATIGFLLIGVFLMVLPSAIAQTGGQQTYDPALRAQYRAARRQQRRNNANNNGQQGTQGTMGLPSAMPPTVDAPLVKIDYTPGSTVNSAPTLGPNHMLYVGSPDHTLYALNADTGALKWKFAAKDIINASPAVGKDGTVYITSRDHNVYAIDGSSGAQKWLYTSTGRFDTAPAVGTKGLVYVGGSDKKVTALDAATGQKRWEFETDDLVSSPVVGPDGTVYVGSDNVYALDGTLGTKKWAYSNGQPIESTPVLDSDGTLYVGSMNGPLIALETSHGTQTWACSDANSALEAPAMGQNSNAVYIGGGDFYALRPSTGRVRWSFSGRGVIWSTAVVDTNGTVIVGCSDGFIYALDHSSGRKLWEYDTSDPILTFPTLRNDGTLYLSSQENKKVTALNIVTGKVVWTYTENAAPALK